MKKIFYEKKNEERIGLSEREETFSGRRIGQFAYLSGREELVVQRRIRNRFICQKGKGLSKRI